MIESEVLAFARRVLEIEAGAILDARSRLSGNFLSAIKLLLSRAGEGRVVVMGVGKSGHIARKIAATLSSTGTPGLFVHPGEAGHGDLGMITKRDVVIAISQSGESEEIIRIIPYLKLNQIPLIAMTGGVTSQLARSADVCISTLVEREACPLGLAPTSSTTVALALGDAAALTLLECRGFTANDFALTHPLGSLGRRLLIRVADVMMPLSEIPVVDAQATISATILSITKHASGFAIIADDYQRPLGIFTDGDLRRTLGKSADIIEVKVEQAMTVDFVSIGAEKLAADALALMKARRISVLPVIDQLRKLVGAITMKQIIAAGIP